MKNIIIGIGMLTALAALVFILNDEEVQTPEMDFAMSTQVQDRQPSPKNELKVAYEHSAENKELKKSPKPPVKHKPAKKVVHKMTKLKYLTHDASKRYEIVLIDESIQPYDLHGKYTGFSGTINGSGFGIRVPDALRKNDLELRIRDTNTGITKTIPIPGLEELTSGPYSPTVQVDFESKNLDFNYPDPAKKDFP